MARRLDQDKKLQDAKNEPVAVKRSPAGPFDGASLKEDVNRIIDLANTAANANQPVKDEKARIKAERGYHMGGFGVCTTMARAEPLEARDMWLTIKAYATAAGLDDPDLVDRMQSDFDDSNEDA